VHVAAYYGRYDWEGLHDLGLSKLMSAAELDVATAMTAADGEDSTTVSVDGTKQDHAGARRGVREVRERRGQGGTVRTDGEDDPGELHFLHPWHVSATCPGVRCDGMHFGSFYHTASAGFECASTKVAWHDFLAQFLAKSGLGCPRRAWPPRAAVKRNLRDTRRALAEECLQNYSGW
jgi:hypothetical protein